MLIVGQHRLVDHAMLRCSLRMNRERVRLTVRNRPRRNWDAMQSGFDGYRAESASASSSSSSESILRTSARPRTKLR